MGIPGPEYFVVLFALGVDALVGDPRWLFCRIPHPVELIGGLVNRFDRRLNLNRPPSRQLAWGVVTVFAVVGLTAGAAAALDHLVLQSLPGGWVVEAVLASTLIAFRGLFDHVQAVARGLEQGLDQARAAVSAVVGRDPESLDEAGVARAAVESLAENFSDGVIAPLFWYLLGGLPALAAYKAVNTLDSMIGHRRARYRYFGKPAARLDDGVNFIPARLAGMLFVAAAALMPGARASAAWQAMWRFASLHRSPNAGWQEAALAGALGFALAGPRRYGDEIVDDAWMGDGRAELTAGDVRRSLHLYLAAGGLAAALIALLAAAS